jgi:fructoselysine-6-P-deglycase FrlB-like protein
VADLHPEHFAADVQRAARVLCDPPADLEPLEMLARRTRRVLFLGMGSSRFAALDAATLLRSHGVDANAEMASTGLPQPATADTLVLAISATGGSAETVTAMRRHLGTSMVVGLTARVDSPIGEEADLCVQIATDGPSGVACASYRSTVAVLQQVCGLFVPGPGPEPRERADETAATVVAQSHEWCRERSNCSDRGRCRCWHLPSASGAQSSRRSCCARCRGSPPKHARPATGHTSTST